MHLVSVADKAELTLYIGILVVFISFFILLFNVELPNEMKGFVFYVQVIGLVYRPYSIAQSTYDKIEVSP